WVVPSPWVLLSPRAWLRPLACPVSSWSPSSRPPSGGAEAPQPARSGRVPPDSLPDRERTVGRVGDGARVGEIGHGEGDRTVVERGGRPGLRRAPGVERAAQGLGVGAGQRRAGLE